jgi:hypothetical protein
MPKLRCKCETMINYGYIPSRDEWLLISDTDYDGFSGMVDTELLYSRFIHMLKCPVCERLHVFWNGFDQPPQTYRPESPSENNEEIVQVD